MHLFVLCGFFSEREGFFFTSAPSLDSNKHNTSRHIPEMDLAAVALQKPENLQIG